MIQPWTDDAKERLGDLVTDDVDERLLLQRLAQGDTLAFWAIWMRYQKEFYSYCLRWMGGNREEAEDALSNASLRACKYLPIYASDITNVKGWLIRLVYNHCMSIRRTLARRNHVVQKVNPLPESNLKWHSIVCDSPEEVVSRQEILQNVHGAIGNLPPRLYETAKLRLIRDLSYRDIATQLNLSPENARKRVEQARCLLRTSLRGTAFASTASKE